MTVTASSRSVRIGPVCEIPIGEGRSYLIRNELVAIFRTRTGEVYGTQAGCPHRNGPLADGVIGEGQVMCPLHGYIFRLATGEPVGQGCASLRTYPVSVDAAGIMVVTIDD